MRIAALKSKIHICKVHNKDEDSTCSSHGYQGHTDQNDSVALAKKEHVQPDDENEDEDKDEEGENVSKHDSTVQRKCIDNDIVEKDSYESSEDVDEADIKDNGGAREDCLEVINSSDEAVVREEEPCSREDHGQVHKTVAVMGRVDGVGVAVH